MSNDNVVTATRVSSALNPGSRVIETSRLTTDRCVISTPFGRPVDPDVKITYAKSSGLAPLLCDSTQ